MVEYDAIAREYGESKLLPFREHVERHTLFELLGDVRGKTVLDLACGDGFYTRLLRQGGALEVTGTATFIAAQLVAWTGAWGPLVVLAALYCIATLLTQVMSNAAATVLLAPVAITVAATLGVSPYPFVVALAIATSTAFMTPIGHQTSIIVYAPGGYRFFDFARAGAPLVLLLLTVSLVVVPLVWPF